MKAVNLLVIALAVAIPLSMKAQSSSETELDELKAQMKEQQKLLEKQQARIETLESALATQQKTLAEVAHSGTNGPAMVPAVAHTADVATGVDGVQAPPNQAMPSEQQPLSPEAEKVQQELQRGPEIGYPRHTTRPGEGPPDRVPGTYDRVPLDELRWERRDELHQPSL